MFNGHCWRSKNEVISDLFLWEPKYGKSSIGGQARTFVDLLETDTGVRRDCLPAAMDDRVGWRKRAMGGRGGGSTEVDLVVVVVVVVVVVDSITAVSKNDRCIIAA